MKDQIKWLLYGSDGKIVMLGGQIVGYDTRDAARRNKNYGESVKKVRITVVGDGN